jgi:hypothetical protein
MMTERPDTYKGFAETFEKIVKGEIAPPNLEEMTNDDAVYQIATFHWLTTKGQFRGLDGNSNWATYFHGHTKPHFDGGGFVLHYVSGNAGNNWKSHGKAARFAICKHKKTEEGHSPNHSRGWHPGHCELCGLDMSVDSGD